VDEPAVLIVNTAGVIQSWSRGAEQLLGHQESVARGKTLDLIVPEEHRDEHWAGFHRAMAAGSSMLDGAAGVLPVGCGDGRVRQFAGRLSLLRDPAGRVVGAMAVYVDTAEVTAPLPVLGG